jgi:hypothetical protein
MNEYPSLGTTAPIFVPRSGSVETVRPGKDYLYVQIAGAQAAFRGSVFTRARRLIVASTVSVSRAGLLKDTLQSIQRSRAVRSGTAENLGIRSNLIGLVPAVMTDFSMSIDYLLDQEDRIAALAGVINDNAFQSTLSLAPGAGMVAKAVSDLAQKLMQAFVPTEERRPILQFTADFNLAGGGVRDGYHVILGSQDPGHPLPRPLPAAEVRDGDLLLDGRPVTEYSYVILDIRRAVARTRDLNDGAAWEEKFREAEDEAQLPGDDARASWETCRGLLREAQTLLRADPNYLREEADAMVASVLTNCKTRLDVMGATRSGARARRPGKVSASDLRSLQLPDDLDVAAVVGAYGERTVEARAQLRELDAGSPEPGPLVRVDA